MINIVRSNHLFEDYKTPGRGNYFVLLNTNLKPKDNSSMAAAIRDIFLARLNTFIKIHYKSSSKEYNEKVF